MTLKVGIAWGVIGRKSFRMPFDHQRAKCQRLGRRPIDALAGLDRLAAVFQEALDGSVGVESLRYVRDLLPDLFEHLERRAGMATARVVGVACRLDVGPAAVEPIGAVGLVALARFQFGLHSRA